MTSTTMPICQSLYTTYGTVDLSIADDALANLGLDARAHTGMKSTAVLLWDETVPEAHLTEAERSLTSAGFTLERISLRDLSSSAPDNAEASLATFMHLTTLLAENNITSSDALIAIGEQDLLNLALAVGSSYARKLPGPVTCALVPTTYDALLLASAYPAALPLASDKETATNSLPAVFSQSPALSFVGSPSFIATSPALLQDASSKQNLLLAQALMVKAAFIDSQNTWEALLKAIDELARASALLQEQEHVSVAANQASPASIFLTACARAAKSLALVEHAQTVQTRSTSAYGNLFAAAMSALNAGISPGQALTEGLRLAADLGVTVHNMPLDYAIEQSAALETLGLPETNLLASNQASAPDAFVAKVKQLARQTTRTLQAVIPIAPGKLALTPLSDELLKEMYQRRYIR